MLKATSTGSIFASLASWCTSSLMTSYTSVQHEHWFCIRSRTRAVSASRFCPASILFSPLVVWCRGRESPPAIFCCRGGRVVNPAPVLSMRYLLYLCSSRLPILVVLVHTILGSQTGCPYSRAWCCPVSIFCRSAGRTMHLRMLLSCMPNALSKPRLDHPYVSPVGGCRERESPPVLVCRRGGWVVNQTLCVWVSMVWYSTTSRSSAGITEKPPVLFRSLAPLAADLAAASVL